MILQSRNVYLEHALKPAALRIEDKTIVAVLPYGAQAADVDYNDDMILPGFLDIHTHGCRGISSLKADPAEIRRWQLAETLEGVTSFLAATESQSEADNLRIFHSIGNLVGTGEGAELLGLHIEGNFIDPAHRGAHDQRLIVKPDAAVFERYWQASGGTVRLMTMAVELDEGHAVMHAAAAHGVRVSVGHSGASYAEVCEACRDGLASVTHTYNGMAAFHHRETGIVGAAMTLPSLYAEVIADGFHVSWPAVQILAAMKDAQHLILVTDASPYKDSEGPLPQGVHRDAEGQFRTESGALASSSLRVCDGIRNLIEYAQVPFAKAVSAATENPARMLGLGSRKGTLAPGMDADIAVVSPNFEVIQTYCRGKACVPCRI